MNKLLSITAFLGAFTIVLGAFGAHALKDTLTSTELDSFNTAVRYQMYHVIVLLIVNLIPFFKLKIKKTISFLFLIGICCFSGSIYLISFGVPAKTIWFITPFGGLLFILGWLILGWSFFKLKSPFK